MGTSEYQMKEKVLYDLNVEPYGLKRKNNRDCMLVKYQPSIDAKRRPIRSHRYR